MSTSRECNGLGRLTRSAGASAIRAVADGRAGFAVGGRLSRTASGRQGQCNEKRTILWTGFYTGLLNNEY
jgi:hypothetical protein